MSTTFPSCPGRHRVTDYSRKWYIPPGKQSSECTYCESCYAQYVKDIAPNASEYRMQTNLYQCNCDYPKDYSKYALEKDGLRVTVTSKDGVKMFQKVENTVANLNGVMHVDLPSCTEYIVNIEKLSDDPDEYITFESGTVGDKQILVENGRRIYYPYNIELKGFKTGTNDSFMFISQTEQEKSEGRELEGENKMNVITVKVNRYRRERVPRYYDDGHLECYGGDRSRGISKGGGGYFKTDCMEKGISKGGIEEGLCMLACSNMSGGTTVSGGSYVDHVRSQTTSDRFSEIGRPIEFMIQLVCTQSEEEKYRVNEQYHLKQAMTQRDELRDQIKDAEKNVDYYKKEAERAEKRVESELEKLSVLREKIKKFDFLGSSEQRDHLIDFNSNKVISVQDE